jgi:hypothetical protein
LADTAGFLAAAVVVGWGCKSADVEDTKVARHTFLAGAAG